MIVIVASQVDEEAQELAAGWPAASLLTPADLSAPGWCVSLSERSASVISVAGQIVPASEITGVITRLPLVYEDELVQILPEDRAYAAAEMTAFLSYWISSLQCPVLNPPTPVCLVGPPWRQEQWVCAAARLGIPVKTAVRDDMVTIREEEGDPVVITIVGECALGSDNEWAKIKALELARVVGVGLLQITFRRHQRELCFGHASLIPSFQQQGLREAVISYFQTEALN